MANSKHLAFVFIFSLVPLGPLAIDLYLPSLPEMMTYFAIDDAAIKLSLSLYIFALGIGQLIAGPISDAYGRKVSSLIGLGIYCLGSVIAALSQEVLMFYLARVAQGLGAAFTLVTAFAWIRDNFQGEQAGKWLSYMGGITSIIPTLAPLLGSVLTLHWGWRAGFVFMALLALTLVFLGLLSMPCIVSQVPKPSQTGLIKRYATILNERQFLIYSAANLFSFAALLGYIANAPIVLMQTFGLSEFAFAICFGLTGLAQVCSSLLAPKLAAKVGQRFLILLALSIVIASGLALLVIENIQLITYATLSALGVASFSLLIGSASALNLAPFATSAGTAAALDGSMRMLGGAALAVLLSALNSNNIHSQAWIFVLCLLPWFLVAFDLGRHNQKTAQF